MMETMKNENASEESKKTNSLNEEINPENLVSPDDTSTEDTQKNASDNDEITQQEINTEDDSNEKENEEASLEKMKKVSKKKKFK